MKLLISILILFIIYVYLRKRYRRIKSVNVAIEYIRLAVSESRSQFMLQSFKNRLRTARKSAIKSQRVVIDELIADITRRQHDWMTIELDDVIDAATKTKINKNNVIKLSDGTLHHIKPTHLK